MFLLEILYESKSKNCVHFGRNYGNFVRVSYYASHYNHSNKIELYEEFDSLENEHIGFTFFRI